MAKPPPPPSLNLVDSGFFVLRTPLFPIDELVRWSEGLQTRALFESGADPAALEAAWAEDVALLRRRLREVLSRAEVQHALYVASPSLGPGIEHWKRDPDS